MRPRPVDDVLDPCRAVVELPAGNLAVPRGVRCPQSLSGIFAEVAVVGACRHDTGIAR